MPVVTIWFLPASGTCAATGNATSIRASAVRRSHRMTHLADVSPSWTDAVSEKFAGTARLALRSGAWHRALIFPYIGVTRHPSFESLALAVRRGGEPAAGGMRKER